MRAAALGSMMGVILLAMKARCQSSSCRGECPFNALRAKRSPKRNEGWSVVTPTVNGSDQVTTTFLAGLSWFLKATFSKLWSYVTKLTPCQKCVAGCAHKIDYVRVLVHSMMVLAQ